MFFSMSPGLRIAWAYSRSKTAPLSAESRTSWVLSTPNSSRIVASFSSRTSCTRNSTLSSKIRLNAFTGSFWPIRSTRPIRCSIFIGFHGRS